MIDVARIVLGWAGRERGGETEACTDCRVQTNGCANTQAEPRQVIPLCAECFAKRPGPLDAMEALRKECDRLQRRCEFYERSRARWANAARRAEPLRAEVIPVASAYATVEHEQSAAPAGSRMREVCDASRAYIDLLVRRDEMMTARLVDLRAEVDEALELLYELDECPDGLVAAVKHVLGCFDAMTGAAAMVTDERKAIAAEACQLLETIPARYILVGDWTRQRDAFVAKHSVPAEPPAGASS